MHAALPDPARSRAKGLAGEGDRQGQGARTGRERQHFRPRALPGAEEADERMGPLPHVAGKLAAGKPVTIIAFGSSSTQGFGSTEPEFTYPNRLAAQLRRQYPVRRHHRDQRRPSAARTRPR